MNLALLGKWQMRFGVEEGKLWREFIGKKYGTKERRWMIKNSSLYRSSAIWKAINSVSPSVISLSSFSLGDGARIRFWEDTWCGPRPLLKDFLLLASLSPKKNITIDRCFSREDSGVWCPLCKRGLSDSECEEYIRSLLHLQHFSFIPELTDSLIWSGSPSGSLMVRSYYNLVRPHVVSSEIPIPSDFWSYGAPPKMWIHIVKLFEVNRIMLQSIQHVIWAWHGVRFVKDKTISLAPFAHGWFMEPLEGV